jgi:uncharacterized membrane protein SirB2
VSLYEAVKAVHVGTVAITASLFVLRGLWMMAESPQLQQRWVRILPHVNDTLLLASAIALAAMSRQYPFVMDWLTAKLLALVAYIVLGSIALKYGKAKSIRVAAFLAALAVLGYIVAVALGRNPLPWQGL